MYQSLPGFCLPVFPSPQDGRYLIAGLAQASRLDIQPRRTPDADMRMIVLPTRIVCVMRAPVLRAPIELHTSNNLNVHLILYVLVHVDSKKRARAGEGGGPSLRLFIFVYSFSEICV